MDEQMGWVNCLDRDVLLKRKEKRTLIGRIDWFWTSTLHFRQCMVSFANYKLW